MVKHLFRQLVRLRRKTHPIYNDDIFLVSFPRSGNTWVSFMLGNVLSLIEGRGREVNFFTVQDFLPEYDNSNFSIRPEGVAGYPRIIKSHGNCTYAFPKVLLLVRDPRDVMASYFHYLRGLRLIPDHWSLNRLTDDSQFGIDAWVVHTRGWLGRATAGRRTHVYRYEDFLEDPVVALRAAFTVMGWEIDQAILVKAVNLSEKKRMKELEQTTRDAKYKLKESDFQFVRKGKKGEGSELPLEVRDKIVARAGELMQLLGYRQ